MNPHTALAVPAAFFASVMVLIAMLAVLPRRGRGIHRLVAASRRAATRPPGAVPASVAAPARGAASVSASSPGSPSALAVPSGRPRFDRPAAARPMGVVERRRLLSAGDAELARTTGRRLGLVAVLVALSIGIAASLGPELLFSSGAVGVVVAVVVSQRSRQRRHRAAAARRSQIIEACDVLAADLSAGRPPQDALEGAAAICPDLQIASAAAKLGGDVAAALDLAAESPGAAGLRALGASWRVAEESGAAFATIVERLADSLRADESVRRHISANLAGTRSTARLLAGLPLFGTALGYAIGANPMAFLTATPVGWLCLTAGLSLAVAGLLWTDRISTTPQ